MRYYVFVLTFNKFKITCATLTIVVYFGVLLIFEIFLIMQLIFRCGRTLLGFNISIY